MTHVEIANDVVYLQTFGAYINTLLNSDFNDFKFFGQDSQLLTYSSF